MGQKETNLGHTPLRVTEIAATEAVAVQRLLLSATDNKPVAMVSSAFAMP
jgi:hypothetical protein